MELASETNVRVCVRFRPINEKEEREAEKRPGAVDQCVDHLKGEDGTATIQVKHPDRRKPMDFTLDDCFEMDTTQQEMFYSVAMLTCKDVLRGYNGTVFCYGQTGSGKTFTMYGPEGAKPSNSSKGKLERMKQMEFLGIVPRAMSYLFYELSKNGQNESFCVNVTCVEIYLNRLQDLLKVAPVGRRKKRGVLGEDLGPRLRVRQNPDGSTYCENARTVECSNVREFLEIMNKANTNRTVSETKMNKTSSRSHSILQIFVEQKRRDGCTLKSKLNFVDLAGSEKVRKSEAKGQTLKEAMKINKTLMELGLVIKDLSQGASFVSYRNTDLTYLLKDSLGGNTKTTLIVCCSPALYNITETISTLQFGTRCKLVKNNVRKNKEMSPIEMRALIKKLRIENRELKSKLTSGKFRRGSGNPEAQSNIAATIKANMSRMDNLNQFAASLSSGVAADGGISPTSAKPVAKGKRWDTSWPKWLDEDSDTEVPRQVYVEELRHQRVITEKIISELDSAKNESLDMKKQLGTEMEQHQALQLEFAQIGDRHKETLCKLEIENAELKADMDEITKMLQLERENRDLSLGVDQVASSNKLEERGTTSLQSNVVTYDKKGRKVVTKLQRKVMSSIKLQEDVPDSPTTAALKQVRDRRMSQFSKNLNSTNEALQKQHNALKQKNTTIMDLMKKLTKIEKSRNGHRNQISDYMEMIKSKDDQLIQYDNNKMNLEAKIDALQLQLEKQAQAISKMKGTNRIKAKLGKKKNAALDSMLEEQEKFLTELAPTGEEFEAVLMERASMTAGEDSKASRKRRISAARQKEEKPSEARNHYERIINTHSLTRYATEQTDSEDERKEAAALTSPRVVSPAKWDPPAVGKWLRSINLGMYSEAFIKNQVDGMLLTTTDFTHKMLHEELGVKTLHCQKLKRELDILKQDAAMGTPSMAPGPPL